jgi:hypothetical protein
MRFGHNQKNPKFWSEILHAPYRALDATLTRYGRRAERACQRAFSRSLMDAMLFLRGEHLSYICICVLYI